MSERKFYLRELDKDGLEINLKDAITESELKRRILMITGGDYREGDIDILLHGGDWPVKES